MRCSPSQGSSAVGGFIPITEKLTISARYASFIVGATLFNEPLNALVCFASSIQRCAKSRSKVLCFGDANFLRHAHTLFGVTPELIEPRTRFRRV